MPDPNIRTGLVSEGHVSATPALRLTSHLHGVRTRRGRDQERDYPQRGPDAPRFNRIDIAERNPHIARLKTVEDPGSKGFRLDAWVSEFYPSSVSVEYSNLARLLLLDELARADSGRLSGVAPSEVQ